MDEKSKLVSTYHSEVWQEAWTDLKMMILIDFADKRGKADDGNGFQQKQKERNWRKKKKRSVNKFDHWLILINFNLIGGSLINFDF